MAGEQGHIVAQIRLGLMYDQGQGVTQDYQKALKWYRYGCKTGSGRCSI